MKAPLSGPLTLRRATQTSSTLSPTATTRSSSRCLRRGFTPGPVLRRTDRIKRAPEAPSRPGSRLGRTAPKRSRPLRRVGRHHAWHDGRAHDHRVGPQRCAAGHHRPRCGGGGDEPRHVSMGSAASARRISSRSASTGARGHRERGADGGPGSEVVRCFRGRRGRAQLGSTGAAGRPRRRSDVHPGRAGDGG